MPALTGKRRFASNSLRIWSAGCATGEEPYSVGMLLLDSLGLKTSLHNTIIGTDIDTNALDHAREGVFTQEDIADISQARLKKYFVRKSQVFHVKPILKQLVNFEQHDLVIEPPYYALDLVVCRNVLIYFNQGLQTRVLNNFYNGLKEGGFLLLGKAESMMAETSALFTCLDKKAKLYRKTGKGGGE